MEDFKNPQANESGAVSTSGMPSAPDIRFATRIALKGNWKMAIVLTAIVTAIVVAAMGLMTALLEWTLMPIVKAQYSGAGVTSGMGFPPFIVFMIMGVVLILVSSMQTLAGARISRRVAAYETLDFSALRFDLGDLLKGFRMAWVVSWRAMIIPMLLMYPAMFVDVILAYTTKLPEAVHMLILLGTLIAVLVMMFRRMYSYQMIYQMWAIYPDETARDLANRSRSLMDGHRWRLFCLEMSFFGWLFLNAVIMGLAEGLLGGEAASPIALMVFTCVWGFVTIPLTVYIQTAQAVFVRDLMARKANAKPVTICAEERVWTAPAQAESAEAVTAEDAPAEIAPVEENAVSDEEDKGEE